MYMSHGVNEKAPKTVPPPHRHQVYLLFYKKYFINPFFAGRFCCFVCMCFLGHFSMVLPSWNYE